MAARRTSRPVGRAAGASASRPGYVVVFRRPSEANVAIMSAVLKAKAVTGIKGRTGRVMLQAKSAEQPEPLIYQRLGVAVTDLTQDEVNQLRADERVAVVAPNQLRRIPPPPKGTALPLAAEGVGPARSEPPPADDMAAYLRGMRDAADLALRFRTSLTVPGRTQRAAIGAAESASHSWCLDMVGISASYAVATGVGIRVAVLDTGIDLDHEDFSAKNLAEGVNALSFIANQSVQDGHGHGTHCCGVVAGPAVSSGGRRYGVAPAVDLLVGKVLGDDGSGWDDGILDGIDWAAEQGARVISMSLGSNRSIGGPFAEAYEALAENLLTQDPGVLIIAAAGNGSARPFFVAPVDNPAACPSIMAIAAVDRDRSIASFSSAQRDNIGEVNLSAPGVDVHSAWTGNTFLLESGTSMATPHVAGVAALYLEREPGLTASQLWVRLQETAVFLGTPSDLGNGLVQAPTS